MWKNPYRSCLGTRCELNSSSIRNISNSIGKDLTNVIFLKSMFYVFISDKKVVPTF